MNMRPLVRSLILFLAAFVCLNRSESRESYQPVIDPANFSSDVSHPWYPLKPGTVMIYSEREDDELRTRTVKVTHDTKLIMGVKCRVVHYVVTGSKGEVQEEAADFFAQDNQGNVWYFGEAARVFKGHGEVSNEGSWEAGAKGQPGVMLPANPAPGPAYRQAYLANVVEDMGQIMALNETVTVPLGTYPGCIRTKEWSMLESGNDRKWYAKGIGLIRSESTGGEVMTLVSLQHH
jgi:hypothetical protein